MIPQNAVFFAVVQNAEKLLLSPLAQIRKLRRPSRAAPVPSARQMTPYWIDALDLFSDAAKVLRGQAVKHTDSSPAERAGTHSCAVRRAYGAVIILQL